MGGDKAIHLVASGSTHLGWVWENPVNAIKILCPCLLVLCCVLVSIHYPYIIHTYSVMLILR